MSMFSKPSGDEGLQTEIDDTVDQDSKMAQEVSEKLSNIRSVIHCIHLDIARLKWQGKTTPNDAQMQAINRLGQLTIENMHCPEAVTKELADIYQQLFYNDRGVGSINLQFLYSHVSRLITLFDPDFQYPIHRTNEETTVGEFEHVETDRYPAETVHYSNVGMFEHVTPPVPTEPGFEVVDTQHLHLPSTGNGSCSR